MNLKALKKKIQEANQQKTKEIISIDKYDGYIERDYVYRLADVLLAMKKQENRVFNDQVHLITGGPEDSLWNLKDDNLDNQSDECKSFLINLLLDNGGKE